MQQGESTQAGQGAVPEQWVDLYGDRLFRYALKLTNDRQASEDLVQETFLAALNSRERFLGQSRESTWLFGILKHKVLDHFRKQSRSKEDHTDELETMSADDLFHEDGSWRVPPEKWNARPDALCERRQFLDILAECFKHLSERLHRVFMLRELEELSTEHICEILNIKPNSLWTRISRARSVLRQCLELHWFQSEAGMTENDAA
jgi:RNA polymerase sigma-70 factor (ECF subfamily)